MNTFSLIYEQIARIPFGRVCTYGQIAKLVGNPRLSRVVGYALKAAPESLPCQRVVTKDGVLSDAFTPMGKETHRLLLEMEGVTFTPDGRVEMEKYFWAGE
ncbi:MAG: MGMT family protein [Clostridia bacterium]|nr:MGMT family protein [Clostridia bacterium]